MAEKELSTPRRHWAIRLAQVFSNEYDDMIKHFAPPQQDELTEHLIMMLNTMYDYADEKKPEVYNRYAKIEDALQKKYGKAFLPFASKQFYSYFHFEKIVVEKGIITTDEYNSLSDSGEEQTLTPFEIKGFTQLSLNALYHSRSSLWAKREPEFETNLSGIAETAPKTKTKGIIKRESGDSLTKLNQEQTALLIHFLQSSKALLKDEYLSNTQAGQAFSVLTGYSPETLRQSLSKTPLEEIKNKENLIALSRFITSLQLLVDNELKPKK